MIKKLINTKFKKDLSLSYINQIIIILFGFLQLYFINNYYSVSTFGELSVIVSTAGIFSSLLSARSSEAITKFFKREELNLNFENAKFVLFIGFMIDIATSFILILTIFFLSDWIAINFLKNKALSNEVFLYSFVTLFSFLRGFIVGYLQAKEIFKYINLISIFEQLMIILIMFIFIFILEWTSLFHVILVFLISSIGSFIYSLLLFVSNYYKEYNSIDLIFNKNLLLEYWHFNIKTFFSSTLKAGNKNIDNLIIGYILSPSIVGIYQTMKKILSPISLITIPFSMLMYTKLIEFYETNQKNQFKNSLLKITLYILFFSILYFIISFILLNSFLEVFNIKLISIYNFYYTLLALIIILGSLMWWVRIFSNTINPNFSIYMNLFATIYQLTITFYITNVFELNGMLISLLILNILLFSYWLKKGYNYVYL